MVKNKRNRRNRNKQTRESGSSAPPRPISTLPVSNNPIVRIKRAIRRPLLLTSTTIDGYGAQPTMQFTFAPGATDYRINGVSIYSNALPNNAEFTNLFDQWRLKGIVFRIDMPASYSNGGTTPILMPDVYYACDYDDAGDATISNLLEYPQVQVHSFYKNGYSPLMFKLSPKPLRDIAGSGISTSYGPMPVAPWIRCSEMATPHYGVKLAFDFFGQIQTLSVPIVITIWYELEFRNPR